MATEVGNFFNSIYTAITTFLPLEDLQVENPNEWNGRKFLPFVALNALQNLPETFLQQIQSVDSLVSSFYFPFQQESPTFDIDEEVRGIKRLPSSMQELIGSYIAPLEYILKIIQKDNKVPDYLKHHARHVTHLDLTKKYLSGSQLLNLLDCCRNITTLKVPMISHTHASNVFFNMISENIAKLKKLKELDITNWHFMEHYGFSADTVIEQIVSIEELQHLSIGSHNSLTNAGISSIVDKCKDLQSLRLDSYTLTDTDLSLIPQLTKLHSIVISENYLITDAGIAHLVPLTNLTHLKLVRLYGITDTALDSIIKFCNLEHLDLSYCHGLTSAAFNSIGALTHLKTLTIRNFDFANNEGLKHISTCIKLKTLNIIEGIRITEESLSNLSKLTELENLNLYGCVFINNGSLKCLYSLKKLKMLNIAETRVNFMGVYCIKKQIPELEVTISTLVDSFE